ncbi:unnamed protein product [Microthlaspi erraticum]|uniref:DUF789 domain-containing protein n=1 Tax=Microthlaspi erraticum TaxID=1685480 RepID=A0A6D2I4P6_9BRAS|nr:unnamed protein product [Microthlaspi erraticum]
MYSIGKSNYDNILGWTAPRVAVHYHTQGPTSVPSSSSSSSSVVAEAKVVTRPRIALSAIWDAYEKWSCYTRGVPLSLGNEEEVTQYYCPTLSAMQIFTIKPFAGDSSPRSSEMRSDDLGYLYCEQNEILKPFDRPPLHYTISQLAKEYKGLSTLTSSDLSPKSWISVCWYPVYPIPSAGIKKDWSAAFLTFHYLKPNFPETDGEAEKVNEQGVSRRREVVLRPFAAATYKAYAKVWTMPGTSVDERLESHEADATSYLQDRRFYHNDLGFVRYQNYQFAAKQQR